jgi:multisubunit Na+/H+ antiporter MnhB subunit
MSLSFRKNLAWGTATLVFGISLIHFGSRLHLFERAGREFAIVVFVIALVAVAALIKRYFRDNPP